MEDQKIIDLYFARSEDAIHETDAKYGRYLNTIAYQVLADSLDSEEAVNDTYLKAWNSIPPHRPDRLSLFLGKITRELSIDLYRRRHAKKREGSQYAASLDELSEVCSDEDRTENSPEKRMEYVFLAGTIEKWLSDQKMENRLMFLWRYYYMDPLEEIAERLDVSVPKVKSSLFRLRKSLKQVLEMEGFTV